MCKERRIELYDIIKGLAIFLVVLGHTMQSVIPNKEYLVPIYMFHMPLFMIVSGYFFYPSINKYNTKNYIKVKSLKLLLPSLTWGIINILLINAHKIIHNKPIDINYSLNVILIGMWFLTVLYTLSIIGYFIHKKLPKYIILSWIIVFSLIYFTPSIWLINEIKYLLPFFVIGYLIKRYGIENYLLGKNRYIILFVLIAIYSLCFHIFTFDYTVYKTPHDILSYDYFHKYIIRFVSGLSGSLICIYAGKFIEKIYYLKKYLLRLGLLTLPIYVIHQNFLMINFLIHRYCNFFIIIITTIITIELSIIVYNKLSNKYLQLSLFGNINNFNKK